MNANEIFEEILSGMRGLVGKELTYLSSNDKKTKIIRIDDSHVIVARNNENLPISLSRFRALAEGLKNGLPVHIDTLFKGGGNDRAIIETIAVHLPNVGYMKGNSGRNTNKNKVFQWFATPQHPVGEILDVSDEKFSNLLSTSLSLNYVKLAKPFLLLAGISGTGKSRFVRHQALKEELLCSVAVRPDWHEPSDLLGYVSRLSGTPEYHATDVLSFFVKAWINACDLSQTTNTKLANISPDDMDTFWLCLDEMNLAPVEQYFADYLSVIETREWNIDEYKCEPLLKAATFSCIKSAELENLRKELGLDDKQYDSLWGYFTSVGIPIPPNLIVAGTVNMDETTHGFSRKVIDRALTFDFGKFFPNEFDQYLEPTIFVKSFSFPRLSRVTKEDLSSLAFDTGGVKTISFCEDLNRILKDSAFELAFRALNELLISLVCTNPKDESELQAVWDDFLMTKVLPRIEGDADKLSVIGKDESILEALTSFLDKTFSEIKTERIDFFREADDNNPVKIRCRSIAKIKWMQDRLTKATFTSFWP